MDRDYSADIVDAIRCELIQKVSLVPPLADELLQKNLISKEGYANIRSKSTSQEQMRELYHHLHSRQIKSAFYEALKKKYRPLLEDLVEKYKSADAAFVDEMRDEIVMRVSLVPPLADELMQNKYISKEGYANIRSKSTSQEQMRELYRHLHNEKIKFAFYEALKKKHRPFLDELERKYKSRGADFFDKMKEELIQRVYLVKPLLDELLSKNYIKREAYKTICSKSTSQQQMTNLYNYLNNKAIISAFYEALKKQHRPLLEDLVEEYKRREADFVEKEENKLIQGVRLVMPLADELFQEKYISEEQYDKIRSERTSQSQMRELYHDFKNRDMKFAFYEALKKEDHQLLDELKQEDKN